MFEEMLDLLQGTDEVPDDEELFVLEFDTFSLTRVLTNEDLVRRCLSSARKMVDETNGEVPMGIVLFDDDEPAVHLVDTEPLMRHPFGKQALELLAPSIAESSHAERAVFMSEAWFTNPDTLSEENAQKLVNGEIIPAELPANERLEGLLILLEEKGSPPILYIHQIRYVNGRRSIDEEPHAVIDTANPSTPVPYIRYRFFPPEGPSKAVRYKRVVTDSVTIDPANPTGGDKLEA